MTTPTKRWARRNPILVVFLTLAIWAALVGYVEDIQSCRRQIPVRAAIREAYIRNERIARVLAREGDPDSRQDRLAYAAAMHRLATRIQQPDCFPFPSA